MSPSPWLNEVCSSRSCCSPCPRLVVSLSPSTFSQSSLFVAMEARSHPRGLSNMDRRSGCTGDGVGASGNQSQYISKKSKEGRVPRTLSPQLPFCNLGEPGIQQHLQINAALVDAPEVACVRGPRSNWHSQPRSCPLLSNVDICNSQLSFHLERVDGVDETHIHTRQRAARPKDSPFPSGPNSEIGDFYLVSL